MKYILLAVVFTAIASGIAATTVRAQSFGIGPDGFRFGEPLDRYRGHHMHYHGDHEWNHGHGHHYDHSMMHHHDHDDDEE